MDTKLLLSNIDISKNCHKSTYFFVIEMKISEPMISKISLFESNEIKINSTRSIKLSV